MCLLVQKYFSSFSLDNSWSTDIIIYLGILYKSLNLYLFLYTFMSSTIQNQSECSGNYCMLIENFLALTYNHHHYNFSNAMTSLYATTTLNNNKCKLLKQ